MISYLGSAGSTSATSPITVSYTSTSGNLLVALCSGAGATDAFASLTDNAGNTWINATAAPTSGTVGRRVEIWYCPNAAAITSLTATFTAGNTAAVTLHEFSGALQTANVLDGAFGKVQTGSLTPTVAGVTPSQGDNLAIGLIRANTASAQTYTINAAGYTAINVAMPEHHGIAYTINAAAGTQTGPTWTLGASSGSGSATAVFKAAPITPATGKTKYWNGTAWVDTNPAAPIKYWDGSTWVAPGTGRVKVWNGSTWDSVL